MRSFFVEKQSALVAQGYLFALGAALLVWFALTVRGVLQTAADGRQLGDLFFVGTAVAAGLSLVAMSIQIVIAKAAARLSPEAVRVVGFDFVLAQYLLCGFIVAATAIAYAACVFRHAVLPRWTGSLAIVVAVLNLVGTLVVFVSEGAVSIRGPLLSGCREWLRRFGISVPLSRCFSAAAVSLLPRREPARARCVVVRRSLDRVKNTIARLGAPSLLNRFVARLCVGRDSSLPEELSNTQLFVPLALPSSSRHLGVSPHLRQDQFLAFKAGRIPALL